MGHYGYRLDIDDNNYILKWEELPRQMRDELDRFNYAIYVHQFSDSIPMAIIVDKENFMATLRKFKENFEHSEEDFKELVENIKDKYSDEETVIMYFS